MNQDYVEILQAVFERYIGIKTGLASGDTEFKEIMTELWKRLKQSHRIRVVK